MGARTILTTLFSILIALYIASHSTLISGISPFLYTVLLTLIFALFLAILIFIYNEPNRRLKKIQFAILVVAIVIGIYCAKRIDDSFIKAPSRFYYQSSTFIRFF
ncbi:hypothetical protein MTsPCn5_18730 [Croceitalea sp. MTPC5]|nr:hypothetical protein MTsPCn5_18730 [Croceitalea sp. MTPC5]